MKFIIDIFLGFEVQVRKYTGKIQALKFYWILIWGLGSRYIKQREWERE